MGYKIKEFLFIYLFIFCLEMVFPHLITENCSNNTGQSKIQRGLPLSTQYPLLKLEPACQTVSYPIGTSPDMADFPLRKIHEQRLSIINHYNVAIPAATILPQSVDHLKRITFNDNICETKPLTQGQCLPRSDRCSCSRIYDVRLRQLPPRHHCDLLRQFPHPFSLHFCRSLHLS